MNTITGCFPFAPASWLPVQDRELLDRVGLEKLKEHQGNIYENPCFELKVVNEPEDYFAIDMFYRIRESAMQSKKLVMLLSAPENAVWITVAEMLNKFRISARNVEVFFTSEYANEKGEVPLWNSPYSRCGHFVRYFYDRLDEELRMPMSQIHFFTTENVEKYSDILASYGGADVAYTYINWGGGLCSIDVEAFPAETMDELMQMGSRIVTPMPEVIAMDSMRGMFGCSGDIGNIPPCAASVGPKDIAAAKEQFNVEYLSTTGGHPSYQRYVSRMTFCGPVTPKIPATMLRLLPGCAYFSETVAMNPAGFIPDNEWLPETLAKIAEEEAEKEGK